MTLLEVVVVLALVAVVAAVATGRVRGGLDDAASTVPGPELPSGPIRGEDLGDVRFSLALRGYRMDQVDEVLDRAADELAARDAEIERLRAQLAQPAAGVPASTVDAADTARDA
ncbi:MAG TPA: DivIVA domain-containing protein [Actinomycetales bacterium]